MLQNNLKYSDIPFFPSKNLFTGDLNLVKDAFAIKQAIKNIIMTIRGERPFNVLFGGNPRNFLFENINLLVMEDCKNLVENNINTFEPRVELKNIGFEQNKYNQNQINIIIVYMILETGTIDTISVALERIR